MRRRVKLTLGEVGETHYTQKEQEWSRMKKQSGLSLQAHTQCEGSEEIHARKYTHQEIETHKLKH